MDYLNPPIMHKILVIDDELDILEVVELILTMNNFKVETTTKWQKIDERISNFAPDLILLDVNLGGADGREICTQLKNAKNTANIPIILFSAHLNLINNLMGSKPNGIIAKPFDATNLISTIKDSLN